MPASLTDDGSWVRVRRKSTDEQLIESAKAGDRRRE
jgi:hypothetical protein